MTNSTIYAVSEDVVRGNHKCYWKSKISKEVIDIENPLTKNSRFWILIKIFAIDEIFARKQYGYNWFDCSFDHCMSHCVGTPSPDYTVFLPEAMSDIAIEQNFK